MPSTRGRAWADTLIDLDLVAANAQLNFDLLANAPTVDTLTAIRLIVRLDTYPQPNTNVNGIARVHVGVGVTSLEAFGVNAVPDVDVDNEYPPRGWIYVETAGCYVNNDSATGESTIIPASFRADIRSMRRVDKGKLFMAIGSNDVTGVPGTLTVVGRVRVLCLT